MSSQSDYVFTRVNQWVFNKGRTSAPFYVVVIAVTLLMIAFAEPVAATVAAVLGIAILGWRDIDVVSSGSPEELFFKTFDADWVERTCKYYANVMESKGIPAVVSELDATLLEYFHSQRDMTWTYFMVVMMNRKSTMDFTVYKESDDFENLQQAELPTVPTSESPPGIEGGLSRDSDVGR